MVTSKPRPSPNLRVNTSSYDDDFYGWTVEQADLLRAGRTSDADLNNIAEEIETLGRSEAAALRSSFRLIASHLLKFLYKPERAGRSWQVAIVRERINLESCLADNPGLKSRLDALFGAAYADARRLAAVETGLPIQTFPEQPQFSLQDLRSESFMPGSARDNQS